MHMLEMAVDNEVATVQVLVRQTMSTASQRRVARHSTPAVDHVVDPAEQNITAVARLEASARLTQSRFARLGDRIVGVAGSAWSLLAHGTWFGLWLLMNARASGHTFDPFPFPLLTTMVSLEAIFLTLCVLASQNRMTREADMRAHLDLQVNLLAEQEMTLVLRMLKELCEHLDLTETTQSDEFRALIKRTDVNTLAEQLAQKLTPVADVECLRDTSAGG
jgi:uncharacterized membrane protein